MDSGTPVAGRAFAPARALREPPSFRGRCARTFELPADVASLLIGGMTEPAMLQLTGPEDRRVRFISLRVRQGVDLVDDHQHFVDGIVE